MGNFLDLLLGAVVQDDGVELPHRRAINFVGFLVSDDEANDRIRVASTGEGGGSLVLLGDVNGAPDDNFISSISGDEEDASVAMFATSLRWDLDVSSGEPEISISTAPGENGALQVKHAGARALLASGTAPELGNTTAIARVIGGMRLTTRAISSNITLDTTTKDAVAWISAALERTVTLPPASAGRVLLLPFVGATTPTLKRAGSELINGVASNYAMSGDAAGGLGIAISDGVNWVARTIRTDDPVAPSVPPTRLINTTAPITGGGDLSADRTLALDPAGYVPPTRVISVTAPITGGGDLSANRAIGLDTSALVLPSRLINTTAPITGGGNLGTDLTLALDPAGYVAPTRTISVTAPLTGGGDLSANRTIGIDTSSFATAARQINTTAPLLGGGDLTVNRTLSIDPTAYVAPTRSIAVTAPLTGGGDLSADRTIGIDTSAFILTTRAINTTAPLTGGGNLSADRTLAVSDATGLANGVIRLAGNLAGTATAPLATGLTADTITIQNATGGTHKGSWTSVGLRIGDNTAPGEKLEVVGNVLATAALAKITARNTNTAFDVTTADPCLVADANVSGGNAIVLGIVNSIRRGSIRWDSSGNMGFNAVATHHWFSGLTTGTPIMNASATGLRIGDTTAAAQKLDVVGTGVASGDFVANNSANGKARLAGLVGSTTTHGALYLGNVTPSAANYAIAGNGSNDLKLNAGASGIISCVINGSTKFTFSESNANSIGTFTQTTQYNGGQSITVKAPAVAGDYTVGGADYVIPVDATAAIRTITLPAPTSGRRIIIKRRAGTNNVVINMAGGGTTVDGIAVSSIFLMTGAGPSGLQPFVYLIGDSTGTTGWLIISYYSIQINLP